MHPLLPTTCTLIWLPLYLCYPQPNGLQDGIRQMEPTTHHDYPLVAISQRNHPLDSNISADADSTNKPERRGAYAYRTFVVFRRHEKSGNEDDNNSSSDNVTPRLTLHYLSRRIVLFFFRTHTEEETRPALFKSPAIFVGACAIGITGITILLLTLVSIHVYRKRRNTSTLVFHDFPDGKNNPSYEAENIYVAAPPPYPQNTATGGDESSSVAEKTEKSETNSPTVA